MPTNSDSKKSTSVSSIKAEMPTMQNSSQASTEMQQINRNTEKTTIMSNNRQDSYSSTGGSNSPSKGSNSSSKGKNFSIKSNGKRPKKTQVDACRCEMRPHDDNIMDQVPFYQKCHHKFCYKVLIFALMTGLNVADLISDWLLYRDVAQTENGLVYGPPEDSLRYSLLAFSIIGSLTFTFEVVNLWWEIFRNNPWIDSDLSSAITVWIEDVPQIAINVVIVACREEAISYFQLVKASVIILGAVIRIAISLFKYCSKKALHDLECAKENKESCRHVVYRALIMTGLILTLGGAITIFMFTQSERNADGSINFKVPHSVIDGEFDDQKYFKNVSMFFSHKLVDFSGTLTDPNHVNLVKIAFINDVRKKDQDLIVNLAYDNLNSQKTKVIVTQTGATSTQECFEIDRTTDKVNTGTNCPNYIPGAKSEIIFVFHYVKSKLPGLIFGDITYNVKEKKNGKCNDASFVIEDNVSKRLGNPDVAAMHYFRIKDGTDGEHPILISGKAFYHISDLKDVTEVWKTGFAYCKSSGSLAPHLDTSIGVNC